MVPLPEFMVRSANVPMTYPAEYSAKARARKWRAMPGLALAGRAARLASAGAGSYIPAP
jgi:hypothetical protein